MLLGYSRVSTANQTDGTSLEEQSRKIGALSVLRGLDKFDVQQYEDAGVSGSIPLGLRPAGEKMLADAKAGDTICAVKLDRLFRSAIDALATVKALKEREIDVILIDLGSDPITGTGVAKMIFGIMASFAEFERERIAERMEDGRSVKRDRQGHLGGEPPYGWKVVGSGRASTLVEAEDEQEVVRLVLRFHAEETRPYRIVQALRARGLVNRRGGPFWVPQVQNIIKRAAA